MLAPSPRKSRWFDPHNLARPKHPIASGIVFGALPLVVAAIGFALLLNGNVP